MSNLNFQYTGDSDSGKTKIWNVYSKHDPSQGRPLGFIKWYAPWRKYVFYPGESLFDASCLMELVQFLAVEMRKHKGE